MITITADSHPALHYTLATMLRSNGACYAGAVQPDALTPPARLAHLVGLAEAALAQLTPEERDTFADGEETELRALIGDDPGRQAASALVEHLFGTWNEQTGVWGDIGAGWDI
ncbi:hypothetical protein [Arenibaculum sp.]|jgi:hypothetical protein|uniref:hypothetical protein n=1 Tax=Arenibaculum sp. TaxID=2865862 RepID=UPI002E0E9939|nr:hypothetical protein [Arenibaculum sp.]